VVELSSVPKRRSRSRVRRFKVGDRVYATSFADQSAASNRFGGLEVISIHTLQLRDARVLATASGKDGLALVRRLGADMAVDGRREDTTAAANRFAPRGR
jgi:hypothetical protein